MVHNPLNRANRRVDLFENAGDYRAFLETLAEAQTEYPVCLLAYGAMSNHWHLVLWPDHDRVLSCLLGWLTLTHTKRWHLWRGSVTPTWPAQETIESRPTATLQRKLLNLILYGWSSSLHRLNYPGVSNSWPYPTSNP